MTIAKEQEKLNLLGGLASDFERIDIEIKRAREDFENFVQLQERAKAEINSKFNFVKGILTAGDENRGDAEGDLSSNVAAAMEFVGFQVYPIEDTVRSAIKHDACWVQDADYLALMNVAATTDANLTLREYNRLVGRIALLLRHREVIPGTAAPAGLLVVNHDRLRNPFDRARLYESDEEILTDARDQRVGLLSTVELYKLVLAVDEQTLSQVDARGLIMEPGRVETDWQGHEKPSPPQLKQPAHIVLDGKVLAI